MTGPQSAAPSRERPDKRLARWDAVSASSVEDFKRSLPTGIWIGADEHHAFEAVAVKRRRPKNSARVIDIFDDIGTREAIRQKVAPIRRGRVACDLVTPPAGDRDARPPAVFRRDLLFVAREGSHSMKRRKERAPPASPWLRADQKLDR